MQQPRLADQLPSGWDNAASHYEDTVELITARFVPKLFAHANVAVGSKLLDVATGSGIVALDAARRGADVLATDFSPSMADRLRQRVSRQGLTNIAVEIMDGQALDLPDASFDFVTCNFGVIFFPDPGAGFAEMVRVLRPGGKALITTWGPPERVELFSIMGAAMKQVIPDFTMPPSTESPFPFADAGAVADSLRAAGFSTVDIHTSTEPWTLPSAKSMEDLMRTNPGRARLQGHITPEQDEALIEAAVHVLEQRFGTDSPVLSMEAHVFTATK